MAIKRYFDEKLKRDCFRVRVVRKSKAVIGLVVQKKAFGLLTELEAKRVEKTLLLEAERELVNRENLGGLWSTIVDEWELAARAGDIFTKDRALSQATIDNYLTVIRDHTFDWAKLHVSEIDRGLAWRTLERVEREISIARRKHLRSAVDAVYGWAIRSGKLPKNTDIPTFGFKSTRKEEEKRPEILTLQEIRDLLKSAERMDEPWYPIWAIALHTGMRSGELYALEWSSVDLENDEIHVYRNWTNKTGFGPTKSRNWRTVPVNQELKRLLNELKLKRGHEQFVLPRFQSWKDGNQAEILRKFCLGVGLPSIRFHSLRACFATQLIKDGVAPARVMKICGWQDLKTMQRYIRMAGIETKGATDGLKLLPDREAMGRVYELFKGESDSR